MSQTTRSAIVREDNFVASDPGIQLFVREVRPRELENRNPVLLIHGGGAGGLASFDLPVPGYSVAENLAQAGHPVYIINLRGWEQSTRLPGLDQPADANPPLVTSAEAVRDIGAVVDWIRQRQRSPVALVGHASGGHWAGMYTSQNPQNVSHLVMLNSLYGVDAPWDYRSTFENPEQPGQFNQAAAAYREVTAEGLIANWTKTIPTEDKTQWRDPAVVEAMQTVALANDPTSTNRQPPSIRIPGGFRLDAFNLSLGQKLWDAADVRVPTLYMRGERDHWSRPADLQALSAELVNAPRQRTVTIAAGTHFLFLDRPERGRDQFTTEVLSFLQEPD